jgi:putative sugar O-methyltransferase
MKRVTTKNALLKIRHWKDALASRLGSLMFYSLNRLDKKGFQKSLAYWRARYREYGASKDLGAFIVPAWRDASAAVESYFKDSLSDDFLRHNVIKSTMFFAKGGNMQRSQLRELERYFGDKLGGIIKEHPAGHPAITSLRYLTSHNTIHHASHMVNFSEQTGEDIFKVNRIVEWGGGYGNFTRILKRQNPGLTYVIIDLPVFSFIQATYLSTVFGREAVNMIASSQDSIVPGKINLIPLDEELIKKTDFGTVDVFVSTWALSESTDHAQAFVEKMNFFNARSVLLAHQKRSDTMRYAEDIEKRLRNFEVVYHEQIPYLETDYYLFAKARQTK